MHLPKSRMAKRGMLPKFRPAALGADAQARPSIRPVKPGPPPAPPSPARRLALANANANANANVSASQDDDGSYDLDDQLEASTLAGSGEPSTLDRGPETVTLEPSPSLSRSPSLSPRDVSFDDETQARPVDDHLLNRLRSKARDEGVTAGAPADLGVDYESLPSLQVRPPFDTYERAFSERDPVTQLHAQRESARVRRGEQPVYEEPVYNDAQRNLPSYDDEASYAEPSYPAASHHVAEEQDVWDRREGSGARERPSPQPARSYAAPVPSYDDASDSAQWGRDRAQPASARQAQQAHEQAPADQHDWSPMPPQADDSQLDAPAIPSAPRVPEEMHAAFVVGVQRIRTATPDAWGTPVPPQVGQYLPSPMQAIQSSMVPPQAYAQNPAYAYQQQLQQQAYAQQQQQQQQQPMQYLPPPTAYALSPQQYLQAGQRQSTPMPMHLSSMPPMPPMSSMPPMSASVADRMQRAQPVGGQLTQPPAAGASLDANAKIGRFAWFVAGAAFGITFAFFATGFFNGGKLTKDDAAVALVAPVAPVAAVATGVAAAAPIAPATAAGFAPATAAGFAPVQGFAPGFAPVAPQLQTQPAQAPVARFAPPAPPPRAPRFQAPPPPRRPAAPASQAPRNLGGGGSGADDDARPAPPAAPAGSDLGDLLGAGLKP